MSCDIPPKWKSIQQHLGIKIDPSWIPHIDSETPAFLKIFGFLDQEIRKGNHILPSLDKLFEAFNWTPFDQIKVVILGQDPYPDPKYAHGAAFSVLPGVKIPGSLMNIFEEMRTDLNSLEKRNDGYLVDLGKQGVLLLNTTLSVQAFKPSSHYGMGWETVTSKIIKEISDKHDHVVFILWGSNAIRLGDLIDPEKHLVLKSSHPSFRSFGKACGINPPFKGSKPFSKTNEYLIKHGKSPIVWIPKALEF